jgi:cell surface protein SprA
VPAWEEEFAFESLSAPIIIRRKASGGELLPPLVFDLESYNQALFEKYQASAWKEYFVRAAFEDERTTGRGGLKLDIPVKIRSKTFQRIFGSGTVGLTVTGDIRIQAGLRREDRSEVKNALTRGSNTNLKMEQQQRFAVKGNIGDKVSINVDQDSERAFDFDNNVSLVYEGYGDEIIAGFLPETSP